MVVEEKAIGCQNARTVGCALLDPVLTRSLHEGAECLNRSLVLVSGAFFLGECRARHQRSGDHYSGEFCPEHLFAPFVHLALASSNACRAPDVRGPFLNGIRVSECPRGARSPAVALS